MLGWYIFLYFVDARMCINIFGSLVHIIKRLIDFMVRIEAIFEVLRNEIHHNAVQINKIDSKDDFQHLCDEWVY